MLRTLIDCSRLMLESPWLVLLGFVVVVLPGGVMLIPVLASKLRRTALATSARSSDLIEPITTNPARLTRTSAAKCDFISFVPSDGKLH